MANEYINNRTFESIIQGFQYFQRQKVKYELIIKDYKQTHERRLSKYNDNLKLDLLEKSQKEYEYSCQKLTQFQNQLAHAFYILSENIANYAKFSGIDIDDAIQEGVLICFEKINRFDPRKGKAFNYMTTCILNHFRQLYRSARNYNELKRKYQNFLAEKWDYLIFGNSSDRY